MDDDNLNPTNDDTNQDDAVQADEQTTAPVNEPQEAPAYDSGMGGDSETTEGSAEPASVTPDTEGADVSEDTTASEVSAPDSDVSGEDSNEDETPTPQF